MQTTRVTITGKVQGVFFRQSALELAKELGITGTVRNCPDDSVEIIATGSRAKLEQLIAWCWKGPRRAGVTGVTTQELSLQTFNDFSIIR